MKPHNDRFDLALTAFLILAVFFGSILVHKHFCRKASPDRAPQTCCSRSACAAGVVISQTN